MEISARWCAFTYKFQRKHSKVCNQEVINKAIDDWPRRLDTVIAAEGSQPY